MIDHQQMSALLAKFQAEQAQMLMQHYNFLHTVMTNQNDIFQKTVHELCFPAETVMARGKEAGMEVSLVEWSRGQHHHEDSCCPAEKDVVGRSLPSRNWDCVTSVTTGSRSPRHEGKSPSTGNESVDAKTFTTNVSTPKRENIFDIRNATEVPVLRVEQGREETPRGETPRGETPRGETPRGQTPQRETPHVRVTTLMEKALSRISGRVSSIGGCRTSLERYASEDTVDGRAKVTEQYERIATSSQHGRVVKIEHFARRCLPCPAFERFVNGPVFQFGACSMIVLNACCIAYEVDFSVKEAFHDFDMRAPGTTSEVAFENLWPLEVFFAVFFFLELLARLMANQGLFFFGAEWPSNLADSVVVVGSMLEILLPSWSLDLSIVRVLRVLRIVRTLRVLRLLRFAFFLKDLRLMALAIAKSIVPILWASMLLILIMFLFSVLFLQAVVVHVNGATSDDETSQQFRIYFDSLPMAILTLWMTVTGGVSWWEVARGLLDVSTWYCLCMVLFVIVMLVAVMNIMTGIFVNDALLMASMDRELMEQEQKAKSDGNIDALHALFREIDCDQTGKITLEELKDIMNRKDVNAIFATVGLEVSNATSFFKLLDVDDSNSLEVDEFVVGCLKIRGMAKAVDLQTLMFENKRMIKYMRQGLETITALLHKYNPEHHIFQL